MRAGSLLRSAGAGRSPSAAGFLVAAAVVTAADVALGESVASDRGRTFLPGGGQAPPAPEPDEPPPRATTAEEEREEPPTEEPTTVEEPAEPPPPPTTTEPAPESGETAP